MRVISLLILIIVMAIVLFQYNNNVKGTAYTEKGQLQTEAIKQQLDDSVSKYQENLQDAMKNAE